MPQHERVGRDGARRGIGGLLAAWIAYWAALPVVALWQPVNLFLRLKAQRTDRARLVIDLASEEGVSLEVTQGAGPLLTSALSYTELILWLVWPPLALWVVWLWWTARGSRRVPRQAVDPSVVAARGAFAGLLASWAAYWAALPVVALWRPVSLFRHLKAQQTGLARLRIDLASEQGVSLEVTHGAGALQASALSYTELIFWLVGPPLALWVVWLWWTARGSHRALRQAKDPAVLAAQSRRQLREGAQPGTFGGAAVPTPERVRPRVDRSG
jgi:hypothetical protein